MQRFLLLGCLIMALNHSFLMAQTKGITRTVPSPNASSLGIFGEVPVSFFTGTPNITVPLYKLDAKLPVQLDLNYHAGGVRPETHPGWVGLGWNLSAGGSITRIVNKTPDELNCPNAPLVFRQAGFYYNHNEINTSTWSSASYLSSTPTLKDIEADIFNFNAFGMSGKFFMDETGAWRVQSDRPLKVEFDNVFVDPFILNTGYGEPMVITKTFNKFTIIDENGNRFVFGDAEDAIEYTETMTPDPGREGEELTATTWQLTKIISADGSDEITYKYERGPFVGNIGVSTTLFAIAGQGNGFWNPSCENGGSRISVYGRLVSPVYLKEINYPKKDLRIAFEFSKSNELTYASLDYYRVNSQAYGPNGNNIWFSILLYNRSYIKYFQNDCQSCLGSELLIWLKLDEIRIENSSGTRVLKTASFNYNNVSTERLELLSLQMKDAGEVPQQSWAFKYNDQQLPNYLGSVTDHWGFNNGSGSPYNTGLSGYYNLRQPNDTYARARVLEKITYPTGGFTKFDFELNKYSAYVSRDRLSIVSENGDAGGLRIRKIVHEDGSGPPMVLEYFYVTNYKAGDDPATLPSSGILDVKPLYEFSNLNGVDLTGVPFSYYIFSSSSVVPLSQNSTGSHIGYSEVIEKRNDNSYTRYVFTNHNTGASYTDQAAVNTFNSTFIPYLPCTSLDFTRGKPKEVIQYDNNDHIKYHKICSYNFVGNTATQKGKSVHYSVFNVCSMSTASRQAVIRSAYYNPWYVLLPVSEEERTYGDDGLYISTVKSYEYDATYKQVRKVTTTNSKNLTEEVNFVYPYDRTSISVYNNMTLKNIIAPKIEVANFVNAAHDKTLITSYKEWSSNLFKPEYEQERYGAGNPVTVRNYDAFDSDGNLLAFRDKQNTGRAILWDDKHQLIADASNAAPGSILYQNFEKTSAWDNSLTAVDYTRKYTGFYSGRIDKFTSGEQVSMGANWLTVSLNGSTRFRYSGWVYSNGPSADIFLFMKRAGEPGYFTYVDFVSTNVTNKWVLIEKEFDVPADVTKLNIRIDNNGGGSVWFDDIRLHPAAAQMTTYAHDPLIGVLSKTDANHKSTFYEYDNASRLHIIRDDEQNIIKQICYNYAGQPEGCVKAFGNDAMSWTITRNNCGIDYVAGEVEYSIGSGAYVSFNSKDDANKQALNDYQTNGQNYANSNGSCTKIVYARIEKIWRSDVIVEHEPMERQLTEVRGDLILRFYQDEACTQPASVTGLPIRVNLDTDTWRYSSNGPSVIEFEADGTEAEVITDIPIHRIDDWWNPDIQWWQTLAITYLNHSIQPSPYIRIK